ncbi:MAG: peptidoglycan editing factor PgeF [Geminicoccaceae bacterium]
MSLVPIVLDGLHAPGVGHGFFTRQGGVCDGPFASLHAGLSHADAMDGVRENRRRIAAHFDQPMAHLVSCRQVHGVDVVSVNDPWHLEDVPDADGLVTDRADIVLGVVTADCAPVLFVDAEAGVIGACHAGWRGALAGVAEATLDAMRAHGASLANLSAGIGPCIAQSSYEVGPEFEQAFLDADPTYSRFFVRPAPDARARFDLRGFLQDRLLRYGLSRIEVAAHDTYAQSELFFSNRRTTHQGGGPYGLQLSAITLHRNT